MAYNPGDKYVTPIGIGLFDRLFGGATKGGPYDGGPEQLGMFGPDPFAAPAQAWARQMFGMGVAPITPQLNAAAGNATDRYFGGNGEKSWNDRWDQWFGTDVTGPDGNLLLSPYHQTGLRVGQDYGVNRDAQGNVADPWHSDMFQAALGMRNNLNQDRWLDPENAVSGMRGVSASSPYDMPDPGDYTAAMRDAAAAGGGDSYLQRGVDRVRSLNERTDFDKYGMRGVNQTNALEDADVASLMSGIDREAQLTLANQLPEIQQSMEAMGLGRSGAGQAAMLGSQRSILSQAIRDKQRTMADYMDRSANRRSGAINLATQQGFQGQGQEYGTIAQMMRDQAQGGLQSYENYAGRQGQAAMQGLGDLFQANQLGRQNEQALWAQQMQNRFGKNQGDQNALFQMLGQAGQFGLGQLDAERMGQSQALSDYMNLVNSREGWRSNSLNEMLGLDDRRRSIQQDILNQQMQAGFMPLDLITRLTTGISASNYSPQQSAPWWAGALGGVGAGIGKGVGDAAGSWMSDYFGQKGGNF